MGPDAILPERAPAAGVPLRFFAAGLFRAEELAGEYLHNPTLLTVTHLFTLGFGGSIATGALYQMLPVLMHSRLFSEPLAHLHLAVHAIGVLTISGGFYTFVRPLIAAGGTLVLAGTVLMLVNLALTMRRAEVRRLVHPADLRRRAEADPDVRAGKNAPPRPGGGVCGAMAGGVLPSLAGFAAGARWLWLTGAALMAAGAAGLAGLWEDRGARSGLVAFFALAWVGGTILGMLLRIVPFIVWLHRFRHRIDRHERIPFLHEMFRQSLGRAAYFGWFAGAALLETLSQLRPGTAPRCPGARAT